MVDIDAIRDELKDIASKRETIYYSELRDKFEPDLYMPGFNSMYNPVFNKINNEEHVAERPLFSAVVVNMRKGMPGPGFFENARQLQVYSGGDDYRF